jgi:hypothetical protein
LQRSTHRASSSSTTRRISIMHGITPHDSCELRTRSAESPDFAVAPNPRLHWFIIGKIFVHRPTWCATWFCHISCGHHCDESACMVE